MAKADKKKKGEAGGDEAGGKGPAHSGVRLSAHPRARKHIARSKGYGGIAAFSFVAAMSYHSHLPMSDLMLRATVAGIVGSLITGALTMTVWRHLALAQIEQLRRGLIDEYEARRREAMDDSSRTELERRALAEAAEARRRAPEGALKSG